ncbi:DUF6879 family protein [Streptomyces sp. NBC_01465]|uniref:DUF6879 family protein n=1 Tax=Streptomyces sp. NBC_01465 TaxID=2903878 RepID=UPI002E363FEC|nr:DUF6879 family protein [Streptomyces sp. NBC_01465]
MLLADDDFAALFTTFEHSAFKMETLDYYDVDGEREELAAFLAGEPMPDSWQDNPWVRAMTDVGKTLTRVHIVRSPLTDYLRFELGWGYPGNVKAGEDIRILDIAEKTVADLPDHDFWLFDDARVYRMHYTDTGGFLGAEPLGPEALERYRTWRDRTLEEAADFTDYWAGHPQH